MANHGENVDLDERVCVGCKKPFAEDRGTVTCPMCLLEWHHDCRDLAWELCGDAPLEVATAAQEVDRMDLDELYRGMIDRRIDSMCCWCSQTFQRGIELK